MACGIGACYACVCHKAEDETKSVKVCDEGPIFKAGEVYSMTQPSLAVKIPGLDLKNPIMPASGCFGFEKNMDSTMI